MNVQLRALLDQITRNPGDIRLLADLTRWYVSAQVPPDDRAAIRAVLSNDPRSVHALHQWGRAVPTDDPQRYIRLRLLVHAMTDAHPDAYEASLQIEEVIKWAHRHGVDVAPHIEAVQHVASPVVATILEQRWLAWNRTRQFVEQQIAALLDTLKQKPTDRPALEALATMYIHPDTTDDQRRAMRQLIQARPVLAENYSRWQPDSKTDAPERFYRLMLGVISLTDAQPDARQAAQRVLDLRAFARQHLLDPDEPIETLCRISLPRAEQVLRVR